MAASPADSDDARVDLTGSVRAVEEVRASLAALTGAGVEGASVLEKAFARSFDGLERQVARAARTGEFSFKAMVNAIIGDLARLAVQTFISAPVEGFIKGLFDFGGARATGGPVASGRSYLVGERGPELFTPAGHGSIAPAGSFGGAGRAPVIFNIQARDAASFTRSEAQIAALMNRALQRGARGL